MRTRSSASGGIVRSRLLARLASSFALAPQRFALTPSTRLRVTIGLPRPQETMDPAKWTPSLNQRDELDRAMKTASVLREWAALKKQGIVDDAEFQAMKARLLWRPPPPVEQVSDDEEKVGWSVRSDDEDAQRWAAVAEALWDAAPMDD